MRIPVPLDLKIEDFAGGVILAKDSGTKNCIFSKKPDGSYFLSQRPSVNIVVDASATVSDAKGRGNYYWNAVGALYFVNAGEVYKDNYSTPVREAAQSIGVGDVDSAATTVTVTLAAHGYQTGDSVVIAGADQTEYNGTYTITVTGANTFTYTFAGSATTPATGTITARRTLKDGIEKCYIFELDTYLIILDAQGQQGWYISSGSSTTLNKITDADFPSDLARGGAILNGRLYVLGQDGQLYASDEGNPSAWNALNVIQANYSPDAGMLLDVHHKHLAAYGANTIEYFYDAANPTGSPLAKRQDIVHEVGTIDEDTLWTDNNVTFFVGISRTGGLSVYVMAGFQITALSSPEIDSFLTTSYMKENKHFHASGAVVGGRVFYFLTVYQGTTEVEPLTTLVFSGTEKLKTWGTWELMHDGIDHFPLVSWTLSTSSTTTKGMLSNGDIVTFQDDLNPEDLTLAFGVYESGIYESGIYLESGGVGTPIEIEAVFGAKDFGTMNYKRMDSVRLTGNKTEESQTLTLYASDELNTDWVEVGSFDMSIPGERVNRLGSFRQRNLKLVGAPNERIELSGLEPEVKALRS